VDDQRLASIAWANLGDWVALHSARDATCVTRQNLKLAPVIKQSGVSKVGELAAQSLIGLDSALLITLVACGVGKKAVQKSPPVIWTWSRL
jgi:hypothetical protein